MSPGVVLLVLFVVVITIAVMGTGPESRSSDVNSRIIGAGVFVAGLALFLAGSGYL